MKKIAFPTEDGETITPHMGHAPYFLVAEIRDNGEISYEKREKPHHGSETEHAEHAHAGGGMGKRMFAPISDCQVLIAGGMGEPAYEHAKSQGLEVLLPGEKNIQRALEAYQAGSLTSDMRRIHKH
jgi:predicted Fe-Mo cluster-binding NifX family protein